jgi:hypothetical protein
MTEVIIVCGDKVIRIPKQQYDDVMYYMAGQMRDEVDQNMVDQGFSRRRANQTLQAFMKMEGL